MSRRPKTLPAKTGIRRDLLVGEALSNWFGQFYADIHFTTLQRDRIQEFYDSLGHFRLDQLNGLDVAGFLLSTLRGPVEEFDERAVVTAVISCFVESALPDLFEALPTHFAKLGCVVEWEWEEGDFDPVLH